MKRYKLALVGATGLVGRTVIKVLEEKKLPISSYSFFSSKKSAGEILKLLGKDYIVNELDEHSFDNRFDFVIFSAGSSISKKFAPIAVSKGSIVIDNSSIFRMDSNIPLVVPEVNPEDIKSNCGIIANPNCSTIQAVVALKPLDDKYKIKRIIYSTYQAVSGAGKKGVEDLECTLKGLNAKSFPHSIANNCIPHIDNFTENGYTKEELKMINETKKILHKPNLMITATAVRVPIINSHSESINIEFENDFNLIELKDLLKNSPSIVVQDAPENNLYPLATNATGSDNVFVGRIRRDESVPFGINMWVVADNVRKGAASNAIQILEKIIKN